MFGKDINTTRQQNTIDGQWVTKVFIFISIISIYYYFSLNQEHFISFINFIVGK